MHKATGYKEDPTQTTAGREENQVTAKNSTIKPTPFKEIREMLENTGMN